MPCRSLRLFPLLLLSSGWVALAAPRPPLEESAALIADGKFLAAERIVEPLATVKKPTGAALFQLSQIRAAQHQLAEAVKLADRAVKLDPQRAEHWSQLGSVLWQQTQEGGNFFETERMRKAFERSLQVDPDHVPGLLGLSRFHLSPLAGKHTSVKKARELATHAAKLNPHLGFLELGDIALRGRDAEGALRFYLQSAEAKPSDPGAQFSCGMALAQLDRKAEARARFQTALKLNPAYLPARLALEGLDAPAKPATK